MDRHPEPNRLSDRNPRDDPSRLDPISPQVFSVSPSRVSIIIPCFNAAPWIGETIRSALAQTHADREIIVIDDGSNDDSLRRARTFEPVGVKVVTQPNAGASAARNHGLRLAEGDFIQYLDADDLISPAKIELQLRQLSSARADCVATCRWGRFQGSPADTRFIDTDVFRDFPPIEWLIIHAGHIRMMHPAAWLLPRAVAERAGPWDENLSLNDDGEYFARAALASSGIVYTPDTGASSHYRSQLETSLSGRRTRKALASLYRSGELLTSHLLRAEDSARVRQALADHWRYLSYELFPETPELSRSADLRSNELGGSTCAPPLGRRAALLAGVIGWRNVKRLKHLIPGK